MRRRPAPALAALASAACLALGLSAPAVASSSGTPHVPAGPALVISTPGAEPVAAGGYGAVLLLDGWAALGRAELRAGEEATRRWFAAAALARPAPEGRVGAFCCGRYPTLIVAPAPGDRSALYSAASLANGTSFNCARCGFTGPE